MATIVSTPVFPPKQGAVTLLLYNPYRGKWSLHRATLDGLVIVYPSLTFLHLQHLLRVTPNCMSFSSCYETAIGRYSDSEDIVPRPALPIPTNTVLTLWTTMWSRCVCHKAQAIRTCEGRLLTPLRWKYITRIVTPVYASLQSLAFANFSSGHSMSIWMACN